MVRMVYTSVDGKEHITNVIPQDQISRTLEAFASHLKGGIVKGYYMISDEAYSNKRRDTSKDKSHDVPGYGDW